MNETLPTIGILVLNRNGKEWLGPLYDSLRADGYSPLRIYLVDNASSDGSVEMTLQDYPEVTVLQMSDNLGYCMAYNLAMPQTFADGCDWVVWANNDVLVEPGCLSELARVALTKPGIGVVGPGFFCWDNDEPNGYMIGNHPRGVAAMKEGSRLPIDVDWVEGSFLMVRRDCVEAVGGLDPFLFFYWEEADFCRRARLQGWSVVLAPGAIARHYTGGSSSLPQDNRVAVNSLRLRNLYIYYLADPTKGLPANLIHATHCFLVRLKALLPRSSRSAAAECGIFAKALCLAREIHGKRRRDRTGGRPPQLMPSFRGATCRVLNARSAPDAASAAVGAQSGPSPATPSPPPLKEKACVPEPKPRGAIVIPVRNRPDLLRQCLESLVSQDFPIATCEVFVCDDFSTVDLGAMVDEFRARIPAIQLLRNKSRPGPAAARNTGIRAASAPVVVCVDSDVVCAGEFLGLLIRALEEHPDWVAAEATVLPSGPAESVLSDAPINKGGSFLSAACAYRRDALLEAGGFDEEFLLPACEDVEIAIRLLRLGKFGYVPKATVLHPVRKVTLGTHWAWRKHWKYVMFLAKRHGILGFPNRSAGAFPRLRVAIAAVVTLPAGRLLEGVKSLKRGAAEGMLAAAFAAFDVVCGLWVVPQILFAPVPERRNYVREAAEAGPCPPHAA